VSNANQTLSNVYILNVVKGEKCWMGKVDKIWLWHRRMCHIKFDNIIKLNKTQAVRFMPRISKPTDTICKTCRHGNKMRVNFKTKEYSTSNPLEIVHIGLCGSARTQNLKVESYFMFLIDDYT
jgi:hypothetical protein